MIDQITGELLVEGLDVKISPSLTRPEFLCSTVGRNSCETIANDPYFSYTTPVLKIMGNEFKSILTFTKDALVEIRLASCATEFGDSWQQWSREREKERKCFHDKLLRPILDSLSEDGEAKWGNVVSMFDDRAGGSVITVRYQQRD